VLQAIGTVMTLLLNGILIVFTQTAVAVFGVYFRVQSIALMPLFGMTNAAMSIIAFNYGAQNRSRVMRTWKITLVAGLVMMVVMTAVFILLPEQILSLFKRNTGNAAPRTRGADHCAARSCVRQRKHLLFHHVPRRSAGLIQHVPLPSAAVDRSDSRGMGACAYLRRSDGGLVGVPAFRSVYHHHLAPSVPLCISLADSNDAAGSSGITPSRSRRARSRRFLFYTGQDD
jgi:hypothetical protein